MIRTIFLIASSFICSCIANAQDFCEVDSVYKNYSLETGSRIIQTSDDNFVILSVGGQLGSSYGEGGKFILTKIDQCGNILWRTNTIDSCNSTSGVIDLKEEQDGNIIFSCYFTYNNCNSIRFYKLSPNGLLRWSIQIGDNKREYHDISILRVNKNKLLFTGSCNWPNNLIPKAFALMTDTLGNKLFEDTSAVSGWYTSSFKLSNNVLTIVGVEDTLLVICQLDTNGVKLGKTFFSKPQNGPIAYFGPSSDFSKLFYLTNSSEPYFAHLDLNGNILKDTVVKNFKVLYYISGKKNAVNPIPNNGIIFPGNTIILMDSNLNIVWTNTFDTIIKARVANYSIISNDSSVVSVGSGFFRTKGIGNTVSDFWLGNMSISKQVKSIIISGPSIINNKNGSIQLLSVVSPESALNKSVQWEVDDIDKASINQNGLVTAKANGKVIVTAKSVDGSNIAASKTITINNQGVGINEDNLIENTISIHPNPAGSYFLIEGINFKIKGICLINGTGAFIMNQDVRSENSTQYFVSTENLPNGFYNIKIITENGVYFKKLVVYN